ncbi:uncharacterized protein LOC124657722 [Lolium rigidum]|uniref:uncharacterized protein LOC124657722 n=1 Tax=Lolium rigidum TaxID=89674 RepID=UPI001F5D3104|nr:uncharacterized protein LOC124657722 [Lolium rigidum]
MTRSRRSSNTIQGFETKSLLSSTKVTTLRSASPHKPKPSRETRFESRNALMLRSSSAQSTESELEDEVVHLLVAHHSWLRPWHHLRTNVCTRCSQLGRWMHWKFHMRDVCALDWSLCSVFFSRQWNLLNKNCLQKLIILLCDLLEVKIPDDERKLLALAVMEVMDRSVHREASAVV